MTSNTFVSKTQINGKTVYLKLQWIQNDIDLFHLQVICSTGSNWSGTFSNKLAEKFIENLHLNLSVDVYYENTKKCLTGKGGDEYELYLSASDGDSAIFKWKKRAEDLLQDQGSLTLNHYDSAGSKETLIDYLIHENEELKNNITEMDQKTEQISTELTMCKKELEKFVNIKTSVESTLYAKFVQLINTKKLRIKFLEEELQKHMN